jgi:hypothetical protein
VGGSERTKSFLVSLMSHSSRTLSKTASAFVHCLAVLERQVLKALLAKRPPHSCLDASAKGVGRGAASLSFCCRFFQRAYGLASAPVGSTLFTLSVGAQAPVVLAVLHFTGNKSLFHLVMPVPRLKSESANSGTAGILPVHILLCVSLTHLPFWRACGIVFAEAAASVGSGAVVSTGQPVDVAFASAAMWNRTADDHGSV